MPTRPRRNRQPRNREAWLARFRLESHSSDPDQGVYYARLRDDSEEASEWPSAEWHCGAGETPTLQERDAPLHGEQPLKKRRLKMAAELGQVEAMHLLALECDDHAERIHWLTMAAERGWLPAMHDLGLTCSALHERRRWLLRAARQGWAESAAELGDVECS